jgi:hypothetical protein
MGFTTGITGIAVNGFTGLMGWMGLGWEKKEMTTWTGNEDFVSSWLSDGSWLG